MKVPLAKALWLKVEINMLENKMELKKLNTTSYQVERWKVEATKLEKKRTTIKHYEEKEFFVCGIFLKTLRMSNAYSTREESRISNHYYQPPLHGTVRREREKDRLRVGTLSHIHTSKI